MFFYEFFRIFGLLMGWPIQWIFFKKKVYYEDKKYKDWKKGGKLFISNHYNVFDYGLNCFMVFPRKLFAVTSELPFKSKLLRFGMKFFGTIQANRITGDMSFIDKSAEVIQKGKLVQIFPEGRNTPDGQMHPFKPSYIMIASMANCKIVPIISDGNYGLFKRVSVIVGNEIDLGELLGKDPSEFTKEDIQLANDLIYQKSLQLRQTLEQLKQRKGKK